MQQQEPAYTYDDFSKAYVRLRTLLDSLSGEHDQVLRGGAESSVSALIE
jgi:hypothetical protein